MMFSKHKAIISSLFVTIFLVQLIHCVEPDPAAPTDPSASADAAAKPNNSDATSNAGANNPKPAQPIPAVNIVTKPTTTQQSSTTSMKGVSHNILCNMICTPFNVCRTFLGDAIKSFWKSFLKVRDNIISIYRPPATSVNNVRT